MIYTKNIVKTLGIIVIVLIITNIICYLQIPDSKIRLVPQSTYDSLHLQYNNLELLLKKETKLRRELYKLDNRIIDKLYKSQKRDSLLLKKQLEVNHLYKNFSNSELIFKLDSIYELYH